MRMLLSTVIAPVCSKFFRRPCFASEFYNQQLSISRISSCNRSFLGTLVCDTRHFNPLLINRNAYVSSGLLLLPKRVKSSSSEHEVIVPVNNIQIQQPSEKRNERPVFSVLDLTFSNSEEAYRSKSTRELLRALLVFKLTSYGALVKHNKRLMVLSRRLLGKRLFKRLMTNSFYGHFVAGADVDEIKPVIQRNLRFGVKSILDYSVEEDVPEEDAVEKEQQSCEQQSITKESTKARFDYHKEFADRRKWVSSARTYFYDSEGQCDKNMWTFMKCVDVVAEATEMTGLAAIKLTALGRPQLLLQMSRALTHMREMFDVLTAEQTNVVLKRLRAETLASELKHLGIPVTRDDTKQWFTWLDVSGTGEIDLYNWSNLLNAEKPLKSLFTVPDLEAGMLTMLFPEIKDLEETQMRNMIRRVNKIVEHAEERGVRIMVDAEQTYFQPAISRLTIEMMRKFNKKQAIVFNTYQCYLKQAHENFIIDLDLARREKFCFGAKVVRGAYMDQERERAATVGYEDPINPTYEATSVMYEKVVDRAMLEATQREPGEVAVMVASHNEDSIRYCVNRMKEYGIRREDRVICFAQLLGMCDHISFPLGQSGYSVYKYVPYGPVDEVLPYLSRRAVENKGILAKVKKEKHLLYSEIKHRITRSSSA